MIIDNRICGKTRLAGVIGNPIEHTVSPQLHNSLALRLGIDMAYLPFFVRDEDLGDAVKGLKSLNFIGFNITVPYKQAVMKCLDEISSDAILFGAVNTVKIENGRLYGYNTDAEGFARSFKEETGTGFAGKRVLILGAGGSSRAVAVKTAMEGADNVYIANRTISKAEEIAGIINRNIKNIAVAIEYNDQCLQNIINACDIIINTTVIGMYPETCKSPLAESIKLLKDQVVYDLIYNPECTRLLESAKKFGLRNANGLGMLFYQGVLAFEIWTGIKIPSEELKEAYISFSEIVQK